MSPVCVAGLCCRFVLPVCVAGLCRNCVETQIGICNISQRNADFSVVEALEVFGHVARTIAQVVTYLGTTKIIARQVSAIIANK